MASFLIKAPNQAVAGKNQRTFVGVVTKMHDNYGFVDDDVFFQHSWVFYPHNLFLTWGERILHESFSVIRGTLPRVGEKVMVEASYNPQMPFKWNAYRIQLLNSGDTGPPAPQNHSHPPARPAQTGGSGGGRYVLSNQKKRRCAAFMSLATFQETSAVF